MRLLEKMPHVFFMTHSKEIKTIHNVEFIYECVRIVKTGESLLFRRTSKLIKVRTVYLTHIFIRDHTIG